MAGLKQSEEINVTEVAASLRTLAGALRSYAKEKSSAPQFTGRGDGMMSWVNCKMCAFPLGHIRFL